MGLSVRLYVDMNEVFTQYITHNLNSMAVACNLYKVLWHSDELDITTAKEMIPYLVNGIAKLVAEPDYYKKFEAANGFGTYEVFLKAARNIYDACCKYPEAIVMVEL